MLYQIGKITTVDSSFEMRLLTNARVECCVRCVSSTYIALISLVLFVLLAEVFKMYFYYSCYMIKDFIIHYQCVSSQPS